MGFTTSFLISNPAIMMSLPPSVLSIMGIDGNNLAVIGRYAEGVGYVNLAQRIGACFYSIPTELWDKMTKSEQWAANEGFLDKMINQGKEFLLSNNAYETLKNAPKSDFAKEIEYLEGQGYVVVENGWKMILKQ